MWSRGEINEAQHEHNKVISHERRSSDSAEVLRKAVSREIESKKEARFVSLYLYLISKLTKMAMQLLGKR